ncbi:MAG: 3'-5' exonuclease [Bacteroidales bacterium]|jgi:DNA polymerase-3 subunit epsilon|nr:3'-5' exonuclease [Bacteroidales bacterium]
MKLNITKPIVFFDLETTGINIVTDKIVEISLLKVFPDEHEEKITYRINPERPIPPKSSEIHKIYDEDVKNAPTFKEVGKKIAAFMKDCDYAGYNSNKFDIPLLAEEFYHSGIEFDWSKSHFVDVHVMFLKKEPRTLSAAYKFYCNKNLENAHSADADTYATYEILKAQLDYYPDVENNISFISEFTAHNKNVDFAGRVIYDEQKQEVFNFGKYKGKPVEEVFQKDPSYYNWMMNGDFHSHTKQIITKIKLRNFNS